LADSAGVCPRLVHLDRPFVRQARPRPVPQVAHHQAMVRFIHVLFVSLDVPGNVVLDRLLQAPPDSLGWRGAPKSNQQLNDATTCFATHDRRRLVMCQRGDRLLQPSGGQVVYQQLSLPDQPQVPL